MQKFLRRIELEIIFADAQKKVLSVETYISTGKRDGLEISFNVSKTLVGAPNESTVAITNMSPFTRQKIVSNIERVAIRLYANYELEPRTLIASGDLLKAFPEREGTSNKMTLTFLDGITAILNSYSRFVAPPAMPLNTVLARLAADLALNKDVVVDPSKIHVDGFIGTRGRTFAGKTSAVLDELSKEFAFTWSVQNGVFQAYRDRSLFNEPSRRHWMVSVAASNLMKATPELGDKFMQMIGMKIEAILNPKVSTGDIIDLVSVVYPTYSGTYAVHNITFSGSTFGPDWKMEIDSKQASSVAV